ncbi:MAG: hypothetical protein QOE51_2682 [Actinoplanes sp.]|jgi:hypothetical protein|nr:hypothetical protein [Actinoplanes sp.]
MTGLAAVDDYIIVSARPIALAEAQLRAALLLVGNDSRVRAPGAAAAIAVPLSGTTPPSATTRPDGWLFLRRAHR